MMNYLRRFAYMGLGALLVLTLVIGGVVAFAQDDGEVEQLLVQDDDGDTAQADEAEAEDADGEPADDESGVPAPGRRGDRPHRNDDDLLAEALGITVEALEAAEDAAYAAAVEQAVAEGLLTEEEAEQLQERGFGHGFVRGLDYDKDELLAEALDISVEELEAAKAEVRAARLAAMVEAGALTQEEADLFAAREAVEGYVDEEALAETVQNAYEAAVADALADGAITQAQADQLLEGLSTYNFRFDAFGRARGFDGGRGGRGGHHGGHHGPSGFSAPDAGTAAPALDAGADA